MDSSNWIALGALAFAVLSFWWIQARRGRLLVSRPHSFGLADGGAALIVRLPLVFYNTGAKPFVVEDMRLSFVGKNEHLPQPWRRTGSDLQTQGGDLPAGFPVGGRQAVQTFVEFGGPFPGFRIEQGLHPIRVEAILAHKGRWETILECELSIPPLKDDQGYTVHPNTRPTKSQQKAMQAKLEDLLSFLRGLEANRDQKPGEEPREDDQD